MLTFLFSILIAYFLCGLIISSPAENADRKPDGHIHIHELPSYVRINHPMQEGMIDPFENLAKQMIQDIFEGQDEESGNVVRTVQTDPKHHKTVTKTSGPGFQTVVVTEMVGGNRRLGEPIMIPIFHNSRRIHLKKVNKEENPFKVFQDLDSIFESFLDGFAQELHDDQQKHSHKEIKELKTEMEKLEDKINNDVVVTSIRDITKGEINETHLPAIRHNNEEIKEEDHIDKKEKKN